MDLNKIIVALLISMVLKMSRNNKDVWLISERRDEAEDNGYHLFKYLRENIPQQKVFYVIDKNSASYSKIQKYGSIVQHNSLSHYIYYFLSNKHLSAFQFFGVPETPILWKLERLGVIKKKKVFLQHGITKEMLPFLHYKNTGYNLFVCGAKPEYEYINDNFGYPLGNVKYLGFCRFDNLHILKEKRQILLMPTWRQWFGMTNINNLDDGYQEFIKSDYYRRYTSLLNSPRLQAFLNNNDIQLVFYPHPEMQRYLKAFKCECSNIIIANRKNYNLQELLKESKLLITDYSSIAFDFAYMRKPLIYYQFDQERYYNSHFKKGYFDCDRNGFGPVIADEEVLINNIEDFMNRGETTDEIYINRASEFFPIYDQENCKRHYEVIRSL